MRNKYITTLLVILTATGVEAQDFKSALQEALGEFTVEEIMAREELSGFKSDILSVLKELTAKQKKSNSSPSFPDERNSRTYQQSPPPKKQAADEDEGPLRWKNASIGKNNIIRAPSRR